MTTNSTFTNLLSNFINETKPSPLSNEELQQVLAIAGRQSLAGVVAYMCRTHALSADPALNGYLRSNLLKTVYMQAARGDQFRKLSAKLSEAGIAHMPVKGYYLKDLYPEPDLRTYGDIDVLIHPADRQRCHELLQELGYQVHDNWEPTYSYSKGSEVYEFHTNLMDGNLDGREDLMAYFGEAWQHNHISDGLCYEPDLEFHFIYTCVHLAKHLYGGGAGMRMYMDAAFFVKCRGGDMDWSYIDQEFDRLKLKEFYYMVLTAVESWFGITVPADGFSFERCDRRTIEDLERYTLDADLFGKLHDHSVIAARNASAAEGKGRVRLIISRIFPSAEVVGKRYTFVARHRWLLPVGWVVRLFTNIGSVRRESQHLKKVAALDEERVTEYDVFMKKLGL